MDRDEARFALAVKEMSERRDWRVPSNFGEPHYNKPILSRDCRRIPRALAGVSRRPSGGQQVGATWGIPLSLAMFLAWGILEALVTHGGFFSEGKAGITCSAGR